MLSALDSLSATPHTRAVQRDDSILLDVAVFGGGIAGLWLLDELRRRGYNALLLESRQLGSGQTVCAQGIIHGGLKYSLDGLLNASAEAIREMPAVWRACLNGSREPQLPPDCLRSDVCHLWRTTDLMSQFGMLGARMGLRVTPRKLPRDDWPAALAGCPGDVFELAEQVIDPVAVLRALCERNRGRVLQIDALRGLEFDLHRPGDVRSIRLVHPNGSSRLTLRPARVVLAGGAGNAGLRARMSLATQVQQLRPLHMVMARGPLPPLNGHCTDGAHTRVTISTTADSSGRTVWQIGGQLAENPDEAAGPLLARAERELRAVLPGLRLNEIEWASYRVDRAEAASPGRKRPSDASLIVDGGVITCWPTKLALAPRLAERVLAALPPPATPAEFVPPDWPTPEIAPPPWESAKNWRRLALGAAS